MADFREELRVVRCTDQTGKPVFIPRYNWCRTKTDLADGTVEIVDFGEYESIGKICQVIDDFEPTERDMKLGIKAFLAADAYNRSDEY
jgi:hypothetical protein